MTISIKIKSSELTNLANKLAKSSKSFSLVGTESEVKKVILSAITEQIASQGTRSKEPWLPLLDNSGRTPLNRTGDLDKTAKNPSVEIEGLRYLVTFSGPGEKQLAVHDKGFTVKKKLKNGKIKEYKVVERKVIRLVQGDIDQIRKIIVKQFKKNLLKD